MKNNFLQILSTRALDPQLLAQAAEQGIHIEGIPFLHIQARANEALANTINRVAIENRWVIFTSVAAVEAVAALCNQEPNWKLFCIAPVTHDRIRHWWPHCSIVASAPNGAQLAPQIVAAQPASVVFFCGNRRLDTIPRTLQEHKIPCEELVVYDNHLTPVTLHKKYDGYLFFSPSTVESFLMSNSLEATGPCFSIGPSTTRALQGYATQIIESAEPTAISLVAAVAAYQNPNKAKE